MPAPVATVIVPTCSPYNGIGELLESLRRQTAQHEIIVVDNGAPPGLGALLARFPEARVSRQPRNIGFGAAVNIGARLASTEVLVVVNDDCICEPQFVAELAAAIEPAARLTMAAGVLLDRRDPTRIESAGIVLDETLFAFDHLHGKLLEGLGRELSEPLGPSGGAAAYHRDAFLSVGGFDEAFFAYWEDVDLALRLRARGARCRLASGALAVHRHSTTLGHGSARKHYLTGFGRAFVLRRWRGVRWRSAPALTTRELSTVLSQLTLDRTLSGLRGRVDGWLAARGREWPGPLPEFPKSKTGVPARVRQSLRRRRLR